MRFCLNCGNPVGGSPWYCAGCGAPINPGPVRDVFAAQPAGPGQPGLLQADQDPPGHPGPAGLAARVTFTSHQNPAASPDHAACDHWDITLFVRHRAGRYQIRRPQPGFPQSVRACG